MKKLRGLQGVVGLATLAVVIILAASAVMLWQLHVREVKHASGETQSVARLLATNVDEALKAADVVLHEAREKLRAADEFGLGLSSHVVHMDLTESLANAPQIRSLFVVTPDGKVVNSSRNTASSDASVTGQPYFKAFAEDPSREIYFGGLTKGRTSRLWKIYLARRLTNTNGNPIGLIVASMDASYFEHLFSLMQLDFDRKLALYMDDGTLFASHPTDSAALGLVAAELKPPNRLPNHAGQVNVFAHTTPDGVAYTYAVARTNSFPMLVGVGNDDAETQSEWRSYAGPIALGALLTSALIIAVGLVLHSRQRREEALSAALNEASRRASVLVDTMMDAIVTIDDQHRIVVYNPAAERLFGWTAAQMLGQPLDRLLPECLRQSHEQQVTGFVASGVERRAVVPKAPMTVQRSDGSSLQVESTISRAMVDGRLQLTAALRDVTEREHAKANLQQANTQLRKLADALQTVRDAERLRLARELHDDLGQRLTGLKLDLSWLSDKLKKEGSSLAPEVDNTRANLDSAMAGARRIWTELQPVMIDDLGFGDAVDTLARETSRHGGIQIRTDLQARAMMRKGPVATALFRVVQEAVNNLVRHAQASEATLRLVLVDEDLVLSVTDNGQGFEPDAHTGKGLGLVSMRERVAGLGGRFQVDSSPGRGTTITITIPLAVAARDEALEPDEEPT